MKTTRLPSSSSSRRLFRHPLFLLAVLLVLAGGGYAGWKLFTSSATPQEEFLVVAVQRGDLEDSVAATGTLQPKNYVDVGAQVSGQLKKIHVDIGSQVEAGQLLAEIDPTVYMARVDAGRAQLRNQRAQMADRQSQLTLADLQFKRQQNLAAADATTTEAVQKAEAELRSARAQIESLRAQIEQTDSTLRADEANLNYARIYAPIGGTVVSITAREGQTLNANQQAPTILRVADLSTMTVQTQVSEADVGRLRNGMRAYFTTLGSPDRRFSGSLDKVEPTPVVQNNVVLFNALFDVPNPDGALMTQMTAQVFFVVAEARDALLVPVAAVKLERGASRRPPAGNAASVPASQSVAEAGVPGATRSPERQAAPPDDSERPRRRMRDGQSDPAAEGQRPALRAGDPALTPEARRERFRQRAEARGQRDAGNAPAPASAAQPSVTARNGSARAPIPPRIRRGTVRVIDEASGRIEERQVEIGVSNRILTQVISGLNEGDKVIAGKRPGADDRSTRGGQQNQNRNPAGPGAAPRMRLS